MKLVAACLLACLFCLPAFALDWQFIPSDEEFSAVFCLVADDAHSRVLLGTAYGYCIYSESGGTWLVREGTGWIQTWSLLHDPRDDMYLMAGKYTASFSGTIHDHYGLTLEGISVWSHYDCGVLGLERDPLVPDRLFASCGMILRSTNNGQDWEQVHFNPYDWAASVACASNGDIYVGYGPIGYAYDDHGIVMSVDGGDSWNEASGDLPLPAHVGGICIDPADPQHLFIRQGGGWEPADPALGVYETVDGGAHWVQRLSANACDLAMHPEDASVLACATNDWRLMLTTDGGASWDEVSGDTFTIFGNCVINERGRLYAGGPDGLWAAYIDPTATGETPAAKTRLTLHPNPFNPSTTIRFSLSEAASVDLRVFDLSGRCVRHLAEGERDRGEQIFTWDGIDDRGAPLSSGLYCITARAGENRISAKALLLK